MTLQKMLFFKEEMIVCQTRNQKPDFFSELIVPASGFFYNFYSFILYTKGLFPLCKFPCNRNWSVLALCRSEKVTALWSNMSGDDKFMRHGNHSRQSIQVDKSRGDEEKK